MFRNDLFEGKRFLVTGGGTGLGKIMLERFVELGADCVICGRRGAVLEETAREIMARYPGRKVDTFAVDIRVATAVEEMVGEIWAGGPLDGLVNNAAGNFISQTKDLSPRAFDAIANIVLHGTFYMTNACGKRWIAGGLPGTVLSNLVTWVWTGSAFVTPSAMSKAAIQAMTMSLAVEWGPKNIRLNAIAPGPFPTPNAWEKLNPIPGSSVGATQKEKVPLRRFGEMHELRNLTAFLISDACTYINGATVAVDGGHHLAAPSTFADLSDMSAEDWAAAREALRASAEKEKQGRKA